MRRACGEDSIYKVSYMAQIIDFFFFFGKKTKIIFGKVTKLKWRTSNLEN